MISHIDLPDAPPGTPLDQEALRSLVDGLAGAPGLWGTRVRHDPHERCSRCSAARTAARRRLT